MPELLGTYGVTEQCVSTRSSSQLSPLLIRVIRAIRGSISLRGPQPLQGFSTLFFSSFLTVPSDDSVTVFSFFSTVPSRFTFSVSV